MSRTFRKEMLFLGCNLHCDEIDRVIIESYIAEFGDMPNERLLFRPRKAWLFCVEVCKRLRIKEGEEAAEVILRRCVNLRKAQRFS